MKKDDNQFATGPEQARRQRKAADRILAEQAQREGRQQDAHTNSVATVESHVGLAPHDKVKSREMEARKTDLGDMTGDPHLRRAPLRTPGKGTTDEVTVSPPGAQPAGGAAAGPGFADRAAAAADAGGGKKAREKAARGKRRTRTKAE